MLKALVTACMAFILSSPAFADMQKDCRECDLKGREMGSCDTMGDRMGDMMGQCLKNADKIGLSEGQVAKLTPIHREMQKRQAKYVGDLKIAQIELTEIMDIKDFDLEKANAAVRKISEIKTTHHQEMLKSMKEVRSILTDEQYKKMKNIMHKKQECKIPPKKTMKKK